MRTGALAGHTDGTGSADARDGIAMRPSNISSAIGGAIRSARRVGAKYFTNAAMPAIAATTMSATGRSNKNSDSIDFGMLGAALACSV